ncbi:hypothetical protein K7X08_020242 [Anisodus acutangulus]|uniref:Fe2OG dioxygenase domain-containing protein n=1 Tax=Anisodus acutangulus TaxID=402998 RepID=A0A9Q1RET5_9SOLA|nr:hypothetical protein K7X08_020242 [Anisodus acutangulus]
MADDNESSSSFSIGETAQEKGLSYVPKCYMIPPSQRPSLKSEFANVTVVDLAGMNNDNPLQRSIIIHDISKACRRNGFFQVTNHGISQVILDGALSAGFGFFELPTEDREKFMSNDVYKPVGYGTGLKDGADKVQFWRVFLKSMIGLNCGLKIHWTTGSSVGLEILDVQDNEWRAVQDLHGTLQVLVGDHLEVLSNGLYKTVVHRVTLNSHKTRISIASLHSLGMDEKMKTAEELVDNEHPKRYKESSFLDFLKFLDENDIGQGSSFLMTLKNN